jgi:hypothetical protein
MRGSEMPQQLEQLLLLERSSCGTSVRYRTTLHPNPPPQGGRGSYAAPPRPSFGVRTMRVLGVLAMVTILGTMLAACGRCGDFLPSSLGQIGACHSDQPPQK